MPGPVYLDGGDVTLRTIEREDLAFCQRHVNDPAVRRGTGFREPVTADDETEWYEEVVLRDGGVHLLVCAERDPVGVIGLAERGGPADRVRLGEVANVGYWIAPEAQGNGYATAACRSMVAHGFDSLGYHKVIAEVAAFNGASRRVLETVGFEREGTLREEWFADGEYVDVHRYGVLAREWPE